MGGGEEGGWFAGGSFEGRVTSNVRGGRASSEALETWGKANKWGDDAWCVL